MAVELAKMGHLGCYYSGYPKWKLPYELPLSTHSLRTTITYGLLKLPSALRPPTRRLYKWQDHGFDRSASRSLDNCDFLHAMPGQCLRLFQRAKALGIRTVLNHATGPVRNFVSIMAPEYARYGLEIEKAHPYDAAYFVREAKEYELSDFHCVASSVVQQQLQQSGIPKERIWVVPYAADRTIFYPPPKRDRDRFRIVFAGEASLRKDVGTLVKAVRLCPRKDWEVHFYGNVLPEVREQLLQADERFHFHGPVSWHALAEAFRNSSVLVLTSLEEGFGLVVPQALNAGLPCVVSDRVGAKDLIQHRVNGSIIPPKTPEALLQELLFWAEAGPCPGAALSWETPARILCNKSIAA